MYVTDTPVVDRITDRFAHETDVALYSLESALGDLEGWIEETSPEPDDRPRYSDPSTPAEIHKGLSDALSLALRASDHLDDALTLPTTR